MKSIFEMKGTERAAALLVALGPEIASDILKHLSEDEIEKITVNIAKIEKLTPHEKEDLMGEFLINLRKERRTVQGGESKARELLVDAFGDEKADELLKKVSKKDVEKEFSFFTEVDSEPLILFLKDEHPQTIAVTLSCLPSGKAADVLKSLHVDMAKSVSIRMAKMSKISPEAVVGVAKALKKKYKKYQEEGRGKKSTHGLDSLIDILNNMSSEEERRLMGHFDNTTPEISKQIREKVFTFENIINLTNNEIRILIDEINDDYHIAMALKGAGDDIRFKFLRNMSQNRASDILNEMDLMSSIRLTEVEDSRNIIVSILRDLNDNGVISIRKDGDIYVE